MGTRCRLFVDLNSNILRAIAQYPTGGGYLWDAGDGVTKTLVFKGSVIAQPDVRGGTYCCGLTFEIWFTAIGEAIGGIDKLNLSVYQMKRLKADWYVSTGMRRGCVDALVLRSLGCEIDSVEDAIPGDLVQLWRKSGSGHSVVFIEKADNGIKYFSTQKSTDGIGYRIEKYSGNNPITELYIVRATT